VQLGQGRPLVPIPVGLGKFAPRDDLPGLHGADGLFCEDVCLNLAPHKFRMDNRQIEIEIVGNDRLRLLDIFIELREHFMKRGSFRFRPFGCDPVNPGRFHGDGEVRGVDDETVLALPVAFGIVERPGQLDNPRPFFCRVCGGISGKAGGFGVDKEEHRSHFDICVYGFFRVLRL